MGRAVKQGLEYFPFDIDFFQDIKIRKLIRYQGGKAITVYTLLLCIIYRDGYYTRWDEELPFIISELSGYEEAYIREVIKCCMNVGLFNKEIYDEDRILTSKGIQERYVNIQKSCKRGASVSEFNCLAEDAKQTDHIDKIKIISKTANGDATDNAEGSTLDDEIRELKAADVWLDNLQLLHHTTADELKRKLEEFRLQCIADGKTSHEGLSDAKRHFNNWLRKTINYDKDRTDSKAGRRGNILKADQKKTYSGSF